MTHVAELITNNRTIETITLSNCNISSQANLHIYIFQALTSLTSLEYLGVNNIVITNQSVDDLTRFSISVKLRHLRLGNCLSKLTETEVNKIMVSLKNHKELTHLNFNDNIFRK